MKTTGLSSWLPPTRFHAFMVALGIGCAIGFTAAVLVYSTGCAAEAGARQIPARRVVYMKGVDGRTIAVAPGPEVVP